MLRAIRGQTRRRRAGRLLRWARRFRARPSPAPVRGVGMFDTYVGTTGGVYRLRDGALEPLGLEGERIWAIHAFADDRATVVLAGSYGNGLYRSDDDGRTWSRVEEGLTASA